MLTKAADTKYVKDNWELFSSDDPNTPMRRAFQAHTLMRKDGRAHNRERTSAMDSWPFRRAWVDVWTPSTHADVYVGGRSQRRASCRHICRPAAPVSARSPRDVIGLEHASDADLCRWSQTLIDGAGNFGWRREPFDRSDKANDEINAAIQTTVDSHEAGASPNAVAAMLDLEEPMEIESYVRNIKIVIGGGINEIAMLAGLLSNPDQKDRCA